jgi:hypothetical protein
MSEQIGRLGYLGLAIEATPGTPESSPDVFIPFTENTLRGHHEPLGDVSARASRIKDVGSVQGKRWGEGQVTMYLDSLNAGYLLKLAFGAENRTQLSATPPVHDHHFVPTVSGNSVAAATLWNNRGVDVEQFSYAAVDTCEVVIGTDGIATITANFMSKAPSTVSAPSLTTTSGTLYTWKDLSARFGSTVAAARLASATKLNNLQFTIANNLTLNYKSGSNQPDTITTGSIEVTGQYTLFFETATDRDAYYNLTKRSMVVTLAGAGLGVGYTEQLEFVFKKVRLEEMDMETGLDDLFAITGSFRAELDQAQAGYVEATARNGKASDYS